MSATLYKRALGALLIPMLALSLAACGAAAQPATPTAVVPTPTTQAQSDAGTPVPEADPGAPLGSRNQ